MSPYKHLTLKQREVILIGIHSGKTLQEIAIHLKCSKSTISREINRNGGKLNYSAVAAHERYQVNRKKCRRGRLLNDSNLRDFVANLIVQKQWSPEQISNRLRMEKSKFKISYATIYRGIVLDNLGIPKRESKQRGIARKLRHHGKTRKVKGTVNERRGKLNDVVSIDERPKSATNRSRFGHWEGDTVRGKTGHSALVTLVDRKSRFLLCQRVSKVNSMNVKQAIINLFGELSPKKIRTLTPDRGKEFSRYKELVEELNIDIYFPDPHAPYQRGTNENTNGLIREYFPKNIDLDNITDQEIMVFTDSLNNRPRKILGWKTPYEVFFSQKLHLI